MNFNNFKAAEDQHKQGVVARMINWLMASSDCATVRFEDMSISEVRELVFRGSSALLVLVPIPMTVTSLLKGDWWVTAIHVVFIAYFAAHTFSLLTRNQGLLSPLVFLLGSVIMLLGTVAAGHDYLIYLAFTFAGSIYLFLDSRNARLISILLLVPAGVMVSSFLSTVHTVFFMGALTLTFLIMEFLYFILYRQETRLREQTIRDPLTNAYNRRAMMDVLEHTAALSARHDTPSSILMIDIDHFKSINDDFGHAEGDTVLVNLVSALEQRLRTSDKICRYGGEEFVVLLIGAHANAAVNVANSIREMIAVKPLSRKTAVTVSCGVAEAAPSESILQWLERADAALYRAKVSGRDAVCMADESVSTVARAELLSES